MDKTKEKVYKEFTHDMDATAWGKRYYADMLNLSCGADLYEAFYSYTGSFYKIINQVLRNSSSIGAPHIDSDVLKTYPGIQQTTELIYYELIRHALPENIVVYRYTHNDLVKFCVTGALKKGAVICDKAFLSTTLVRNCLTDFARQNRCNCLMKINLPQGIHGAYVTFKGKKSCLNEHEFLLPPNTKLKILKICRFPKMYIECEALLPNEMRS